MDTILARRNLAKERNTAQNAIDERIQQMAVSARETEFRLPIRPMEGDINLSRLQSLNVNSIVTEEPSFITEVYGIPEGVKNIRLEKLLLVDVPQLPSSIETLNLDRNYIETVDFSNAKNLRVLRLNGNRLKILRNLPESLEELYVDNNLIKRLDLGGLPRLRILHCRNNKTLRIENIPASMVDLQVEEGNPQIMLDYDYFPKSEVSEDSNRAKETEQEFVESLHDYFELKQNYENNEKKSRNDARIKALDRGLGERMARKIAKQLRPKCVNCKRPVGTIFKTRKQRLLAYCGDLNSPCPLRIEIFKGDFESDDMFAESANQLLIDTKEQIIRQKMDVLFNYVSEEETIAKFKDLIEDYNLYSFVYKGSIDMREEKQFNVHKRELIKAKLKLLNELKGKMNVYMEQYEETGNRDMVHTAMDIYIKEYMPEVNNLRMLKYGVMEMLTPLAETGKLSMVRKLNQASVPLRQLESFHGEVPRVLKFTTVENTSETKEQEEPEEMPEETKEMDENGTGNVISFNDDSDYYE